MLLQRFQLLLSTGQRNLEALQHAETCWEHVNLIELLMNEHGRTTLPNALSLGD
jgi:hypothetical protein